MKCHRTRCENELTRHCMLIWNEPSTNIPNVYCIKCGRKIIEGNERDTIKLTWEVVQVSEAEFRYPSRFAAKV
jgi:hypothetical protein